jgi:hypothetical protein
MDMRRLEHLSRRGRTVKELGRIDPVNNAGIAPAENLREKTDETSRNLKGTFLQARP